MTNSVLPLGSNRVIHASFHGSAATTHDDPTCYTPPETFGPFRVLHQIGVGVLGPVFRTYDPQNDRLVAVKALRLDLTPEQSREVVDELRRVVLLGLTHPSLVRLIDAGIEGTTAYLAEEYVAAESLDVALRHYAPAPLETVLPFIKQLGGAIDRAAAAGVMHGALHPRDIFLTPELARATGFGVATALEKVGLRPPVRRPYSAPERIDGEDWGSQADVFALAAIAYELMTAKRIAGAGDRFAAISRGEPFVSAALEEVLRVGLADDPSKRYPSALVLVAALEAVRDGLSPVSVDHVAMEAVEMRDVDNEDDDLDYDDRDEAESLEDDLVGPLDIHASPDRSRDLVVSSEYSQVEPSEDLEHPGVSLGDGDLEHHGQQEAQDKEAQDDQTEQPEASVLAAGAAEQVTEEGEAAEDVEDVEHELEPASPAVSGGPVSTGTVSAQGGPLPEPLPLPMEPPDVPERREMDGLLGQTEELAAHTHDSTHQADERPALEGFELESDEPAVGAEAVEPSPVMEPDGRVEPAVGTRRDEAIGEAIDGTSGLEEESEEESETAALSLADDEADAEMPLEEDAGQEMPRAAVDKDQAAAGPPWAQTDGEADERDDGGLGELDELDEVDEDEEAATEPVPVVAGRESDVRPGPYERPRPWPPPASTGAGWSTSTLGAAVAAAIVLGFVAGYLWRGPSAVESAERDVTEAPTLARSTGPDVADAEPRAVPAPPTPVPMEAAPPDVASSGTTSPPASAPSREEAATSSRVGAPPAVPRASNGRASPAARDGRLLIRSTPAGAPVTIDGQRRGMTPLVVRDLEYGAYQVQVSSPGSEPQTRRMTVTRERPAATVTFDLTRSAGAAAGPAVAAAGPAAVASTGSLYIDSRPRGARVLIDDTPFGTTPVLVPDVAVGARQVELDLTGYRPWISSVQVRAGERNRVTGSLDPQRP